MRGDSGDHVVRSPDSPWASRSPGHDHAGEVLGPPDHRRVVPDARRVSEGLDARAAFAVHADAGRHQTLSFAGPPGGVHTHVRLPPVCPPGTRPGVAPLLEDGRAAGDAPAVGGPVDAAGDLVRGDHQRVRVEPLTDDFLGDLVDRPGVLGQLGLGALQAVGEGGGLVGRLPRSQKLSPPVRRPRRRDPPTARDTDSRSSPRNRRSTTSRLRPAENRPPRPRPAATPVATDSSTCFLISTLLLRELSRNQVSKKTLGRRRRAYRWITASARLWPVSLRRIE